MSREPSTPTTRTDSPVSLSQIRTSNAPAAAAMAVTSPRFAKFVAGLHESSLNSFCGAVAGVASGIVTCPLDVIKTKLQAQGAFRSRPTVTPGVAGAAVAPSYRGLLGTAAVIWTQDGLRGMYRGLGPMLIGYLPTWAVYMSVYGASRDHYYTKIDNRFLAQVSASVTAGACSTLVTNPIWVIKTRLMSQVGATASKDARTPWHYHSTWDAAKKMYQMEGIRSFYAGLGPALLGLTHVAIQFPLYEAFKLHFTGVSMGETSSKDNAGNTWGIAAATFLSKICATCATYPHEVLRTRLQTQQRKWTAKTNAYNALTSTRNHHGQGAAPPSSINVPAETAEVPHYRGIVHSVRTILREEGWRAFYYGMGTNLIRAVPAAMTTMLTFETLKRAALKLQEEGRRLDDGE